MYTKEEIYGDDVPERCPDLFYEFGDYWFVGQFHSSELFVDEVSSKHDPYGMLIAWGPDIKAGVELEQSNIADITPTLLHDMGLPVPTYMDGQVLDIHRITHPVEYEDRPLVKPTQQPSAQPAEQQQLNSIVDDIIDNL